MSGAALLLLVLAGFVVLLATGLGLVLRLLGGGLFCLLLALWLLF